MKFISFKIFCYLGFPLLLLSSSCARNPVTGKRDFMLMTKQQEIEMGRQADPEIVAFFGLYEDERLQKFIEEKGQEMAAISHRPELAYEFKIVDSPIVNAFAVPGGYVYFTRGIMAHFNNEAEFAGVLGHEIGHITARHSARQYSRTMLAQAGLIIGMVVSPEFRQFANVTQTGVGLLFLKYGRDAERQSDKLGVEYSSKINYDAKEMAEFFETLHRIGTTTGAQDIPEFLSTHPSPVNRQRDVARHAEEWIKKLNLANPQVNRNNYLKLIEGLVYGEDPRQGFVENNIFYHPVLRFQFPVPSRWQVQNTPQQVQMADAEGRALLLFTIAQGQSLEGAAQQILQNYQLQMVESNRLNVNGLPALSVIADQIPEEGQQQQQTLRVLFYLIQYEGRIYNILGVSALSDFDSYAPVFRQTMGNFSQLTDTEKLNRQPERIRIQPARQRGTIAQALRDYQVPENRLEELALLNGMNMDEIVEQGTLIKTISR